MKVPISTVLYDSPNSDKDQLGRSSTFEEPEFPKQPLQPNWVVAWMFLIVGIACGYAWHFSSVETHPDLYPASQGGNAQFRSSRGLPIPSVEVTATRGGER